MKKLFLALLQKSGIDAMFCLEDRGTFHIHEDRQDKCHWSRDPLGHTAESWGFAFSYPFL